VSDNLLRKAPKPKRRAPKVPKGLKRGRLKARGKRTRKSKGHLFPQYVDEAYREWIRGLPCILLDRCLYIGTVPLAHICTGDRQACHVKNRGAGGKDRGNLYPGCGAAHEHQHRLGIRSFEATWKLDLTFLAGEYEKVYVETHPLGAARDQGEPPDAKPVCGSGVSGGSRE
jgi:hypothetical protein